MRHKRLARPAFAWALCLPMLSVQTAAGQTTITVGQGGGYDYETIQAGIDAATTGDTVLVYPGTYVENIHFSGKSIILRSTDPTSPSIVAATIIDGNSSGSVVTFAGGETGSCNLSGFTIRAGYSEVYGRVGGGISVRGTLATIENNIITSNSAMGYVYSPWAPIRVPCGVGGGMYNCDGTIQNNLIDNNYSNDSGGGLSGCDGTIWSNTIVGNSAATWGGGLDACNGGIQNNTIAGNSASWGSGLNACDGTIQNNAIMNNRSAEGSGLRECNAAIESNTISHNAATGIAGGLYKCNGTICNCIIWENSAPTGAQIDNSSTPSYSCIQDWTGGGVGNISEDPLFTTGPLGTYYLSQISAGQAMQSPCVDAGLGTAAGLGLAKGTTRTDGVGDGRRVDMGYHHPASSRPVAVRFESWQLYR